MLKLVSTWRVPGLVAAAVWLALLGQTAVQANPVPVGVAAWQDTVTGVVSRAIGPGGAPALNYQRVDGSWDEIVDEWVQVGGRQVWKSVRGNHRVFADSTGAAIYAVGNHYLGIEPGPLVKFDKSDSTWVTLKPSVPDSVSVSGRTITFHNVYPHIDLRLVNNAKVFRRFAYQVVFHQQARDSLAAWGPWTGFLLGTATKLNVDSLNLTLRDAAGVFGVTTTGRMVDEWVSLGSVDTAAFYLGTAYLQTEDSTTSIPVKKWLVRFAGSPWLVELFDPIAAGALPAGDLWHNVTFGWTSGSASSGYSLSGKIRGFQYTMGSTAGTMDEIYCFLSDGGGTIGNKKKYAIYETDGTFVGGTVEEDPGPEESDEFFGIEADGTVNLLASHAYVIAAWSNYVTSVKVNFTGSASPSIVTETVAYTASWPDPSSFSSDGISNNMKIYCTYTEASAGRRRHILLKAGK